VLRPGGQLALSTLGPETFQELREAFTGIDRHRHTLSFSAPATIAQALRDAGFAEIRLIRQTISLPYPRSQVTAARGEGDRRQRGR
jgi:malonyl-CoA O-methyltransferase